MQLATLLEERKAELIARWRERVSEAFAPGAAPDPELVNSLPLFIDELRAWLAEGLARGAGGLIPRSGVARHHGGQRFHAGFDLRGVVREYGVLRECILDLAEAAGVRAISVEEDRVLSRAISLAVADAAEQFSRERDGALQRQAAEHLAFLAHELRNPLGSARLALELLRRGGPADKHLKVLERSLGRLHRLVDDSILDVELRRQLEEGLPLARQKVDLSALALEVVAESEADAEAKGLALTAHLAPGLELEGEPRLLRSVVSNLVRNAVKFSARGGHVRVRASAKEEALTLEVEDTCGGLPPGKAEELFLPFKQRGHDRSGFGLGLAITKQAVEAHQGTIQVHNLDGRGCVFLVGLPLSPVRR